MNINKMTDSDEVLVPYHCKECPYGHDLVEFITPKPNYGCDNCRTLQKCSVQMYSCRDDNYDICFDCHNKKVYQFFNATGMDIKYNDQYYPPNACWLEDDYIDETEVPKNTKYIVCRPEMSSAIKSKLVGKEITILSWLPDQSDWIIQEDYQEVRAFTKF